VVCAVECRIHARRKRRDSLLDSGSSKAQTAQRIGRTMRPVGAAKGYLLATKGSNEEDFILSSTKYLAQQGIQVTVSN